MHKEILYIVEEDISEDGGAGINERGFIGELLNRNIAVLIPKPKFPNNLSFIDNELIFKAKALNRRNPFRYLFFLIHKTYLILKIAKKKKIDVLVFRGGPIPLDIFVLGLFTKKKIFKKHLTFLRTSQKDGFIYKLSGLCNKLLMMSKVIDGADTPSFMTKELIVNDYGINNVLVAKNGTNKPSYDSVARDREFIYAGRLSEKRNTDKLLETFKGSNRRIDIYGFGDMTAIVEKYSKECANINFYGKVSFEEIKKILPHYKFGVDFTYVPTPYGRASYSQKIAQYLSYGLNVLAVDCSDNRFIEEYDCGNITNLEDIIEIRKIVENMQFHPIDDKELEDFIYNDKIVETRVRFWNK